MKESFRERFGPLAPPGGNEEPSRPYGQGLVEKLPALQRAKIEQEQKSESRLEASQVVSAVAKGSEGLQHLEKTHPRFWSAVQIAQWNNQLANFFETCASGKNPQWPIYAFHVQKHFSRMEETHRESFASIVAEMHAKQLMNPLEHESGIKGAEVARAHPVLDAGAGVDLLMYVPSGERNEDAYFAIQVKRDRTRQNPSIEEITTETINAEANMRQKNSLERCQQGARALSLHMNNVYRPLLVRMPSYEQFLAQELIDNRTLSLIKTPTLEKWHGNMVEFFGSLLATKGKK